MRIAVWVSMVLFPALSQADVETDKKELSEVGRRMVKAYTEDKPNWSCVSSSGRNFCATGAKHYSLDKEVVDVSGQQLTDFVNSMKEIDAKEDKCIGAVFSSGQFKSKNWKDYDAAIKCLQKIDYEIKKPNDVNYFYIKPGEIFSQNNVEAAIATLTAKRNKLNPALKDDVESAPVSQKQFEAAQKKQRQQEASDKTPPVEPSLAFLKNKTTMLNKKFKMRLVMGDVANFRQIRNNTACEFGYVTGGNDGFGKLTGDGTYWIEAEARDCVAIQERLDGGDSATIDVYVQFKDIVQAVNKMGTNLTMPLLKVTGRW